MNGVAGGPSRARVRVGMVRCDEHAYTYGPLMAECDIAAYRKNCYCEYYFMVGCRDPKRLVAPVVGGFEVARVWDADPAKAQGLSDLFFGKPRVCRALEEVGDGVDAVFINDCNGFGTDHIELASPFLAKGLPTFVDKPFANTLNQAREMVTLAKHYGAPLFSASILTYVDEVEHLRRRFAELHGPISMGVVKGYGNRDCENLGGIIHGIGLALGVFGWGVESVECMGTAPLEHLLLHYPESSDCPRGLDVIVMNTPRGWNGFFVDVYSDQGENPPMPGQIRSGPIYDPEFVRGACNVLKLYKDMVLTGRSPVTHEQLVEKIAIVEAARLAQNTGRRTLLRDLFSGD